MQWKILEAVVALMYFPEFIGNLGRLNIKIKVLTKFLLKVNQETNLHFFLVVCGFLDWELGVGGWLGGGRGVAN